MKIWQRPFDLNEITQLGQGNICSLLAIEFTDAGDDYLTARMPVDERTKQLGGILHGGASCTLAETIGSMGANLCIDYKEFLCVGLDINTNHIRQATSGYVTGTGKPFHLGKTTHVWGINIVNDKQELVSVTRLTMAVLKRP